MGQVFWKKWWWVLAICTFAACFYLHAIKEKLSSIERMTFRYHSLEKEKIAALHEQEDLKLQIASQNDPAWIEMVLMRDLGLVPDGWLKVHFTKP